MARLKPCNYSNWRYGKWRPVKRIRTTVDKADYEPINKEKEIRAIRGGGVPIGEKIVEYSDVGEKYWNEHWYDYEWNVELKDC